MGFAFGFIYLPSEYGAGFIEGFYREADRCQGKGKNIQIGVNIFLSDSGD